MEKLTNHLNNSRLSASLQTLEQLNIRCDQSYSQDSNELDEDKCYEMEIEQLKRQNNFLKKKLAQYTKQEKMSTNKKFNKRPSSNFGSASRNILEEKSQNYILSFIDEISKLLHSFSNLFNLDLQTSFQKSLQAHNKFLDELTKQKTVELNRKLERILMEPQQKKYSTLLEIFQNYYRETTENNKLLQLRVEELTTEAIQLGKKMAVNVKKRQRIKSSVKTSRILNTPPLHHQNRENGQQNLKSSLMKSTRTDSICQGFPLRMSLAKMKFFQNVF